MQKFLAIIIFGLLLSSNAYAKEIVLNCYKLDPKQSQMTAEILAKMKSPKTDSEIDIQKKIFHLGGDKFDIVLETQRKIVAKKSNERITIDRYDGILVLDDESTTPVKNIARYVCDIQKEEKKLF